MNDYVNIGREEDRQATEGLIDALIEAPALARRLYPRGRFEGLEPNVIQVLLALQREASPTVGELVDRLALGQGTVSTALRTLQDHGLVSEISDPADGRRRPQVITRRGRALANRFIAEARTRVEGTRWSTQT